VGVLGAIASVGFYLAEETDEFARTTLIQSLLWGAAGTLSVATVWGFLENFGKASHAPTWAAVPVFAIFMGVAQALIARRYR
jgi:lipopolysaccharide export LptBFGC system permease protein LptF